jgi:WD40 repeat protein/uncharacterized caspase-like protein
VFRRLSSYQITLLAHYQNFQGAMMNLRLTPTQQAVRIISLVTLISHLWISVKAQNVDQPELLIQKGHSSLIQCLAYSPDGRWIASGSSDMTVMLWETQSGKMIRTFRGHNSPVTVVAFSPDGKLIASGGGNTVSGGSPSIKLWDLQSGKLLHSIPTQSIVHTVSFSPDSSMIASSGGEIQLLRSATTGMEAKGTDGVIKLWDVQSGKLIKALDSQTGLIQSVVFSPDGKLLASGNYDKTIKLWDVQTGKLIRSLLKMKPKVIDSYQGCEQLAFNSDGSVLAAAGLMFGEEKTVTLWDVTKGKVLRSLKAFPGQKLDWSFYNRFGFNSLAFNPSGNSVATGASDGKIRIWEVKSGQLVRAIDAGPAAIVSTKFNGASSVIYSPDGKIIAAVSERGSLQNAIGLWNAENGELIRYLEGQSGPILSVAIGSDGKILATAGSDRDIYLWDLLGGRLKGRLRGHTKAVRAVAFSPDGKQIATADEHTDARIRIWDAERQKLVGTLQGHSDIVSSLAYSPDGRNLVSVGRDKTVRLWYVQGLQLVWSVKDESNDLQTSVAVAFSPDGTVVASGNTSGAIKLWDAKRGMLLRTMTGQLNDWMSLAFSPDGKLIASGAIPSALVFGDHRLENLDTAVKVWEVASGKLLYNLQGQRGVDYSVIFNCVTFSGDGQSLAAGGVDGSIKIWDVKSGRVLRQFVGGKAPSNHLLFSRNGKMLIAGSEDSTTKLWSLETGTLMASFLASGDEWLVVTPDGLFDGTVNAWSKIQWRFSSGLMDIAPVEAFFNEFFYPNLLAEIWDGKKPRAVQSISQKDRRQPQIRLALADGKIVSSARTVRVKIEVIEAPVDKDHSAGSGAYDVRLFRNGSLVHVWRGDVLQGKGGKTILETDVRIVAGENSLTAYAFNRDNIKSGDTTLMVTGSESLKRPGIAYVLTIGINNYANPKYNLRYATADAISFGEEFSRQQSRLARFSDVEVIPLFDQNATRGNILLALKRLAGVDISPLPATAPSSLSKIKPVQPEDAVVIYYAGHGTAQANRFFLIPHDLGYNGSRTQLGNSALLTILTHSISDRDLEKALEGVDAGHLLLVIDACNSGQALEAEEKRRGPMNSKGLAQLAYEKGIYILTAAQSYQAALETSQLGHGYLTYVLTEEGLKSTVADAQPQDGAITVREWFDYAAARVPQMQAERPSKPAQPVLPPQQAKKEPTPPPRTQQAQRKQPRQQRPRTPDQPAKPDRELIQDDADAKEGDIDVQRPRVFYRREEEKKPLVVAKP